MLTNAFKTITLTVLGAFLLSSPALATAEIGQSIPHSLQLMDQNNKQRSFEDLTGKKGLVLIFVRSADWCPYCQVQLLDLRSDAQPIMDEGYNIVSISYDSPELLEKFATKYNFPYTMLSDKGSEAIKAFGILNEDFAADHFAYGVPHPHVYVIGNDKIIQATLSEDGYKKRPQIEAILDAVKGK